MDYNDILARFKEVNVTDTFGTKKEMKELPMILKEDETIMYAASGFVDNNTWLITCTDKRLLFLDKGMVFGLKQVEIPIEKINSISYKKRLLLGEIIIYHGAAQMTIKNIQKEAVKPLADAINNEIEKHRSAANNTSIQPTVSAADELLKFKQLLDAEVITQEEFDAKKKELLGL